jgi:hypothetical protein
MKTIQISNSVLTALYGDSKEGVVEVFSEFLTSHKQIMESLTSSYLSGHIDSLRKSLHHHGPTFLYLGFPSISASFKELETQCRSLSSHYSISSQFSLLIKMVDESRNQVINQLEYLKQTA